MRGRRLWQKANRLCADCSTPLGPGGGVRCADCAEAHLRHNADSHERTGRYEPCPWHGDECWEYWRRRRLNSRFAVCAHEFLGGCGGPLQADHIKSVAARGPNCGRDNQQLLCRDHNLEKDRLEYLGRLGLGEDPPPPSRGSR